MKSSSSSKGKDTTYDFRIDNPLPIIEYSNEGEYSINSTSN